MRIRKFNENDEVPIGYKITDAGIYSIAIDELDGIFSESQTIYLKDRRTKWPTASISRGH